MVRICYFFLSALSLFVLAGCNIEGRITTYNGRPMEGVKVFLEGGPPLETVTDSEGYFLFRGLQPGQYTVTAIVDGFNLFPYQQQVTIAQDDIFGIDFESEPDHLIRVPRDYDTIQEAIDKASEDDVILLADGIYTGFGNYGITIHKPITLRSEIGPNNCIIDCQDIGRGFTISADAIISGITITNGLHDTGGAIKVMNASSPTISNCIIKGNFARQNGGGIYTTGGQPTITGCIIDQNRSGLYGGGVYFDAGTPFISGCTIMNNQARSGGGMHGNDASITLTWAILRDNHVLQSGGGAAFISGIHEITNSLIHNNSSQGEGGGLSITNGYSTILNTTVAHNESISGGGISIVFGEHAIENCILWSNTEDQIRVNPQAEITFSHSNIEQDGIVGEGVISVNPMFAGTGNYHLLAGSPCIDSGNNTGLEDDLDGVNRPQGAGYDIGAYEYEESY